MIFSQCFSDNLLKDRNRSNSKFIVHESTGLKCSWKDQVVGKFRTYEVGMFGPWLTSFENFPTSDFPSFSFFEIYFPTTCKPTNVLSIYDQMFHSNVEPLLFRPIFGFRHPWVGNDLWITMRFSTTAWSNCGKLQVAIRTNL